MKRLNSFFVFEFRRLLKPRFIVVAVLFLAALLYLVHGGINAYKTTFENGKKFSSIERQKVETIRNYRQYGYTGFRTVFFPAPLSVFFHNSGAFKEVNGTLDVLERLNIDSSLKGGSLFQEQKMRYADFGGMMTLAGSLMFLFYGYACFNSREWFKMLTTLTGQRAACFFTLTARYIILSVYFLAATGLGIVLALLRGVPLAGNDFGLLAGFLAAFLVTGLFFFLLGTVIRFIAAENAGVIALILIWAALMFFYPIVIHNATIEKAKDIRSNYQTELEKWGALMSFERRAAKAHVKYTEEKAKTKPVQEMMEGFIKREYRELQEVEKYLEKEMVETARLHQNLSIFAPTTFCLDVASNLSSKGSGNVVDFFRYIQVLKDKFAVFFKNKMYYSDSPKGTVESFVKGDENLFTSTSALPPNLAAGLALYALLSALLLVFSYTRFRQMLFALKGKEKPALKQESPTFQAGTYRVLVELGMSLNNFLFNVFNGQPAETHSNGDNSMPVIDGVEIAPGGKRDFFYFSSVGLLPDDIVVKDLVNFLCNVARLPAQEKKVIGENPALKKVWKKTLKELGPEEAGDVSLALLGIKKSPILIFHEVATGLSAKYASRFKQSMIALRDAGNIVIYLTSDYSIRQESGVKPDGFFEYNRWSEAVDELSNLKF